MWWKIIKYTVILIFGSILLMLLWDFFFVYKTHSLFFGYFQKHFNINIWLIKIITLVFLFLFIFYIWPNVKTLLNPIIPLTKKQTPTLIIVGFFIFLYFITFLVEKDRNFNFVGEPQKCMAWAVDHYEEVPCSWKVHPKFGTKVIPVSSDNVIMLKSFLKIKATKNTVFFDPIDGSPKIYYYLNDGIIEFFNSKGFHPQYGEQLLPVTREIIIKYYNQHNNGWNTEKQLDSLEKQLKNYK